MVLLKVDQWDLPLNRNGKIMYNSAIVLVATPSAIQPHYAHFNERQQSHEDAQHILIFEYLEWEVFASWRVSIMGIRNSQTPQQINSENRKFQAHI